MHATGHGSASRFDRIFKMAVIQGSPKKGCEAGISAGRRQRRSIDAARSAGCLRQKLNRSVAFIRSGLAVFPIDRVSGNGKRRGQKRCQSSLAA